MSTADGQKEEKGKGRRTGTTAASRAYEISFVTPWLLDLEPPSQVRVHIERHGGGAQSRTANLSVLGRLWSGFTPRSEDTVVAEGRIPRGRKAWTSKSLLTRQADARLVPVDSTRQPPSPPSAAASNGRTDAVARDKLRRATATSYPSVCFTAGGDSEMGGGAGRRHKRAGPARQTRKGTRSETEAPGRNISDEFRIAYESTRGRTKRCHGKPGHNDGAGRVRQDGGALCLVIEADISTGIWAHK